jgi:ribosomal protein S27AE
MEEQGIVCLKCGASELIREDSERLPLGKWPAWKPGPQEFGCPKCGADIVWATEPRESESEVAVQP